MNERKKTPADLGIFPKMAEELVRLERDGRLPGMGTSTWGLKREAVLEALRWLRDRGFDLCEGDLARAEKDVVAGELWGTADYLLNILEEALPDEEAGYRDLLERVGVDSPSAARLAAETRYRVEYAVVLALELGVLATEAGLREHMEDLLRGKKIMASSKKAYATTLKPQHEKQRDAWQRFQKVMDEIREAHPDISTAELIRKTHRRLLSQGERQCSLRTLRRRTKDPKPPHPRRK